MFNKRDSASSAEESSAQTAGEARLGVDAGETKPVRDVPPAGGDRRGPAVIGPSIHIEGDLRGEEDLVIEGEVKGTVKLKNNSVTIGARGKVEADVYAHTIHVEGTMKGDLFASERLSIRKNAQVRGNITSPRVSLEDGAHFKGSIEMDPEAEGLKSAFGNKHQAPAARTSQAGSGKTSGRSDASADSAAGKTENAGGGSGGESRKASTA